MGRIRARAEIVAICVAVVLRFVVAGVAVLGRHGVAARRVNVTGLREVDVVVLGAGARRVHTVIAQGPRACWRGLWDTTSAYVQVSRTGVRRRNTVAVLVVVRVEALLARGIAIFVEVAARIMITLLVAVAARARVRVRVATYVYVATLVAVAIRVRRRHAAVVRARGIAAAGGVTRTV